MDYVHLAMAVAGLALVLGSAEWLTEGAVATALRFGVTPFLISVVFIGFDPDNLSVGIGATLEGSPGLAAGSILGSAMVAMVFALGLVALLAPFRLAPVPWQIGVLPGAALGLLGLLAWDGLVSRADGAVLLSAYAAAVLALVFLGRRGKSVRTAGEAAEALDKAERLGRRRAVALLAAALVGIAVGAELLVTGVQSLLRTWGLSETFFGMTVLAFLVSVEELARELPPALRGRPDISVGNVVGSALAMFLFNAGAIAVAHPLPIDEEIWGFHLPATLAAVGVVTAFLAARRVPRWGGVLLVLLYLAFVAGSALGG